LFLLFYFTNYEKKKQNIFVKVLKEQKT